MGQTLQVLFFDEDNRLLSDQSEATLSENELHFSLHCLTKGLLNAPPETVTVAVVKLLAGDNLPQILLTADRRQRSLRPSGNERQFNL